MKYDLDYQGAQEMFDDRLKQFIRNGIAPKTGEEAETMHLWDTDESSLQEAERLNMLLPLMKWEAENNLVTKGIRSEIYLYYKDLANGKLDQIFGDDEADEVKRVLTECFNRVFPEGLEE